MTPLAQRIRDTRGALIHWDEQMVRDIATANPPALEFMTGYLSKLDPDSTSGFSSTKMLADALLSFALMRVEEQVAMSCLEYDEDEPAQFSTYAFQDRWNYFDDFVKEFAVKGPQWDNEPRYSTDMEYHTAVNRARNRPDVHQALVTVQRAFAEAANLPLMQLV
jgi:hypothetical protein